MGEFVDCNKKMLICMMNTYPVLSVIKHSLTIVMTSTEHMFMASNLLPLKEPSKEAPEAWTSSLGC